jgi:hypothetical protein
MIGARAGTQIFGEQPQDMNGGFLLNEVQMKYNKFLLHFIRSF